MYKFTPDNDVQVDKFAIKVKGRRVPLLILHIKEHHAPAPGVLWIHGGGYFLGMKEMVYMGRAEDLVKKFGVVVIAPDFTLAWRAPS